MPASGVNSDPTAGTRNSGSLITESVRANLYSIGDQALATIKIMGDPDFLMQPAASSINDLYDEYYGTDGYTVSVQSTENPFAKHWQKSTGLTIPCQLILKDLNETDDASIPLDAIICEVINWEF